MKTGILLKKAISACIERNVLVEKVEIRPIVRNEVDVLRAISLETFTDTFGEYNTQSDLDAYLSRAYDLQKLKKELENPESAFFWALENGEIAGYLKLNTGKSQSEEMPEDHLEIERIYVRTPYKKQGIGTHLMNWALTQAKAQAKSAVWLGVWEHNDPAQAFYRKYGFVRQSQHVFYMGEKGQTDHILVKKLNEV